MWHWLVNLVTDCDRIEKMLDERSYRLCKFHHRLNEREHRLIASNAAKSAECEKLRYEYERVVKIAENHGIIIVEVPCLLL